ncbi:hypothetical protein BDB00DRAFT_566151 [Zychaea mexicana]|uniref:uncharacterized protein n=1 Tax=Zychaea mexicana TaxID=64656 RepID=UPI0022FEEB5C|nr:uncharacterized protein BDB00DRAFT_566151 [Zychaea mexicana]KAI9490156.1 hypothetical protein BDB00DRAFT_566151 [Zychaea mexicana]
MTRSWHQTVNLYYRSKLYQNELKRREKRKAKLLALYRRFLTVTLGTSKSSTKFHGFHWLLRNSITFSIWLKGTITKGKERGCAWWSSKQMCCGGSGTCLSPWAAVPPTMSPFGCERSVHGTVSSENKDTNANEQVDSRKKCFSVSSKCRN